MAVGVQWACLRFFVPSCSVVLLLFAGCVRDAREAMTADQRAVVKAAEDYATALTNDDFDGMWKLLSLASQEWVSRQLNGEGGVRNLVTTHRRALESPGLAADERKRIEAQLKDLPTPVELEKMDARAYYAWRLKKSTTPVGKAETARLFSFENVKDVLIIRNRATLTLKTGSPSEYYFVREGSDWKQDLPPDKRSEQLDAGLRELMPRDGPENQGSNKPPQNR